MSAGGGVRDGERDRRMKQLRPVHPLRVSECTMLGRHAGRRVNAAAPTPVFVLYMHSRASSSPSGVSGAWAETEVSRPDAPESNDARIPRSAGPLGLLPERLCALVRVGLFNRRGGVESSIEGAWGGREETCSRWRRRLHWRHAAAGEKGGASVVGRRREGGV